MGLRNQDKLAFRKRIRGCWSTVLRRTCISSLFGRTRIFRNATDEDTERNDDPGMCVQRGDRMCHAESTTQLPNPKFLISRPRKEHPDSISSKRPRDKAFVLAGTAIAGGLNAVDFRCTWFIWYHLLILPYIDQTFNGLQWQQMVDMVIESKCISLLFIPNFPWVVRLRYLMSLHAPLALLVLLI